MVDFIHKLWVNDFLLAKFGHNKAQVDKRWAQA